jgi:hypothetical protein
MRGNNLFLAVLALILFTISGILIINGVGVYFKNNDSSEKDVVVENQEPKDNEDVELSGYFDGGFGGDSPDSYARNDPFREVCSQVDLEEGTTVVYSNVVCFK